MVILLLNLIVPSTLNLISVVQKVYLVANISAIVLIAESHDTLQKTERRVCGLKWREHHVIQVVQSGVQSGDASF